MEPRKRFIGTVVLYWNSAQVPTDFFTEYRHSQLIFIAESRLPQSNGSKIASSAPQLVDLLQVHRRKVESSFPGGQR